jgi:serine/threonine protein phosphatase PrpC
MKQYHLDIAGLSDRGVKRDHNEDSWSAPPRDLAPSQLAIKGQLYVVADGVGGHQAGDVASKMAVNLIQQHYYTDPSLDVTASLTAAIQAASKQIDQEAAARPERRGMSTTVTAVVLRGSELTVANVGDSRTYLIQDGRVHQITADHSWVEEQVRSGIITRDEAARHPHRNIITRSLGVNRELDIDVFVEEVKPGDSVLLCSDGLSNMVTDQEIGSTVSQGWMAETAVNELVDLTKQRGAPDNVTAVLINIVRRAQGSAGRLMVTVGIVGVLVILTLGLVLGILVTGNQGAVRPSAEAALEYDTPPSPLLAVTSVATPVLEETTRHPLELVWPAENISLAASDLITFVWKWEPEQEDDDGRFIFVLKAGGDAQPLIHEELSLNQRHLVVARSFEPGSFLWTMSVSGTRTDGASAGRLFVVVEPTPVANTPPMPTLGSPD